MFFYKNALAQTISSANIGPSSLCIVITSGSLPMSFSLLKIFFYFWSSCPGNTTTPILFYDKNICTTHGPRVARLLNRSFLVHNLCIFNFYLNVSDALYRVAVCQLMYLFNYTNIYTPNEKS